MHPGNRGHRRAERGGDLGQTHAYQAGVHGGHERPQAGGEQQSLFEGRNVAVQDTVLCGDEVRIN